MSFSSMEAELLAAAEATDRAGLMSYRLSNIYAADRSSPLILTVDSHGLYSKIITLHEGRDYKLRSMVERLRYSFESGDIAVMQ